ncbi:helix-turn-helix domain-containing protein [Pseudoxanthomonas sacheonensis]|uniref:AraC family transcriptional regulator n=1 Tax=Pseudoxanthomonas sacheonensis TaxID=443615 RepID=A0ABU1RXJ4_9GAMM|nr:AraC family transcriptional regulator [Pseudoxanthomonas sacheonensis]MDR6842854.1 AraC family transcriptional regulator [Pseudoxanthomonas sacheonensis]
MKMQTAWIDRNQLLDAGVDFTSAELVSVLAVSRTGSIAVQAPLVSFWLVVRGSADLEAREGRFHLRAGEWVVLESDSRPTVYASRSSLVLGVAMPQAMRQRIRQFTHLDLHTGRGQLDRGEIRQCLRLWRQTGLFGKSGRPMASDEVNPLVPLLRHVCNVQYDFRRMIDHCPGRSMRRKSQVFDRMQRARLFLEGNVDRNVRLAELAELSNVSTWYFTKIFHALYGEGPQAMAARLRLGQAARLLGDTTLSVSEIGAVCGFENNCSFSRAFRERYGTPPSLYRLKARSVTTDSAQLRGSEGKAALAFGT